MLRRLRGIAVQAALWAVPWATAGAVLAVYLQQRGGYAQARLDTHLSLIGWPAWAGGGIGFLAARGAVVGAIHGLLFAGVLLIAGRRGARIEKLARWQFAGLGALAAGAVSAGVLRMPLVLAVAIAAIGAASGMGYLMIAQRGSRSSKRLGFGRDRSAPMALNSEPDPLDV